MKKLKQPVLAEGEVTGHMHRLIGDVDVYEDDDGRRTFCLRKETKLQHEEHNAIEIPRGAWESVKVTEYDHFAEEAREVVD